MLTTLGRFVQPLIVIVVAVVALVPESLLACPVCFGASDEPAAHAMNYAIFTLLGVTGSVLGSFLAFIGYLWRRARMLRLGQPPLVGPQA